LDINLKMLNKIEDHFILIDKCAGQTRIAEIKYRKLIKYISWFENNPPKIGNICEATIIKKLNGGVARAKTIDQTVLSVRGVPQNIKSHSKVKKKRRQRVSVKNLNLKTFFSERKV